MKPYKNALEYFEMFGGSNKGLGCYVFHVRSERGVKYLISRSEYLAGLEEDNSVKCFVHIGVKEDINEKHGLYTMFTSKINDLSYDINNSDLHKGVNKPIFTSNEVFSNFFTKISAEQHMPVFGKNYIKIHGKDKFLVESYNQFKHSYIRNLYEYKSNSKVNMIHLVESKNSLVNVNFNYNGSTIYILKLDEEKALQPLFSHCMNYGGFLSKELLYRYNKLYNANDLVIKFRGEKPTLEEILNVNEKILDQDVLVQDWLNNYF